MLKRIALYLSEMFPLPAIVGSVISAVAVELVYLRLYGVEPKLDSMLILPGVVLTFISLLIRVMDEFKDYEDDLINFPNRPLPSGKVFKSDLKILGYYCVSMILLLSLTSLPLFLWAIVTLCFTGLMLKWFFIESTMRKSLPLAFVSHHPIVIFNFIYLIIACIQMAPQKVGWDKWYYILPVCLIYTNWEIMRKIRAPEDETSYNTYSKIIGPRPAIFITLILQVIYNVAVMIIFRKLATPDLVRVAYLVIQFILILPSLKFLFTLKLSRPLRPVAEVQILVVVGFLLLAGIL